MDVTHTQDSNDSCTIDRLAKEHGVTFRLVNLLGSGSIRGALDVKNLALMIRNADYAVRGGFNGMILRFRTPRASVIAYRSGKFIVIGAKSPAVADLVIQKFQDILQKSGAPHELVSFKIHNFCAACDLKFRKIAYKDASAQYEPELFPGLIYRMLVPKCTMLVFISGKIVITGFQKIEDGEQALCNIFPVLCKFRIQREECSSCSDSADDESEAIL
uniref:TATAboxbinding protein putative n=1 Tax=Albugo laibachii Nc14 TaxID=890382 RepID=F0WPL5_9STRA|nr:TATAboxbinding protein putative [Albugo laibachii Nc14]|eukprot:CCA23265.1 TATAboxbinding protein putative [Albugo laibachii Nc14]